MQKMLSKFWRTLVEFEMIQADDRILVGLSGGKDSTFLLHCLATAREILPFTIHLGAVTVDGMFTNDFPMAQLEKLCGDLRVDFFSEQVNINRVIDQKKYKSPCFSCAYFRRAATNRIAREQGFNKVALGHHHDDAVETFAMNLFTSGQVHTFSPITYLSRSDLTVIRPLVYYREYEIRSFIRKMGTEIVKNPCPHDGCTKREEIKEVLKYLAQQIDKEVYEHLAAAMRQGNQGDLWPAKPEREHLAAKHKEFWRYR